MRSILIVSGEHGIEVQRLELMARARVELAHELHPVETQSVQEGGQALHHHHDGNGKEYPNGEYDKDRNDAHIAAHLQCLREHHGPQHLRELCDRQKRRKKLEKN